MRLVASTRPEVRDLDTAVAELSVEGRIPADAGLRAVFPARETRAGWTLAADLAPAGASARELDVDHRDSDFTLPQLARETGTGASTRLCGSTSLAAHLNRRQAPGKNSLSRGIIGGSVAATPCVGLLDRRRGCRSKEQSKRRWADREVSGAHDHGSQPTGGAAQAGA